MNTDSSGKSAGIFWLPPVNPAVMGKKMGISTPDAEESPAEVVLGVDLTARAITAKQFHVRDRRLAAGAEKFGRLEFTQAVFPVVLAVPAVLPADRPVLFGVFNNRFVA